MNQENYNLISLQALINEIFPQPSNEIITDRFAQPTDASTCRPTCSGNCGAISSS